jgi:hypothetical protein
VTLSRITVNRRAMEDLLTGSALARELGRRGEIGLQAAKQACPVSPAGHLDPDGGTWLPSGHLRSSLYFDVAEDSQGLYLDIGTDAAEALYVEYGTAPHTITSHGDYPLVARDRSGNATAVFGREVHHPGTDPQPFLRPGLDAALRG